MNDEQLDKLFRDQLQELEATPHYGAWEHIEAGLFEQRKTVPLWKKSWMRYAAALVLAAGTSVWFIYQSFQGDLQIESPMAQLTAEPQAPPLDEPQHTKDKTPSLADDGQKTLPNRPDSQQAKPQALQPTRQTAVEQRVVATLAPAQLASVEPHILKISATALPTHRVVEIDPIQPLIENPEEEETMLAGAQPPARSVVTGLLNKITDVVNPDENRTIHFSNDEEGSLRIDIFNSLVKNRTKKRK